MNATEQKKHTRVTDELAASIEALAEAFDERIRELGDDLRASVGDERTHRLKLADEQRGYVDSRDHELRRIGDERWMATGEADKRAFDRIAELQALRDRDFIGRLRWLFRGR